MCTLYYISIVYYIGDYSAGKDEPFVLDYIE